MTGLPPFRVKSFVSGVFLSIDTLSHLKIGILIPDQGGREFHPQDFIGISRT
jgi:hypothetical protein